MSRRVALSTVAAAAATAAWPHIARADVTTVKFGSVGGLSDAGIYIADELGYLSAAGIAVDMQQINAAPTLVQAIAAGQLDVAGISVTPGLFASVALKINLRIVGDKQSYRHGFSGMRLIASPKAILASEAATIAGLRGKTVALSAKAGVTYYLLDRVLASQNLTLNDVKIVELPYPSMYPAFTTGAIDAAISLEPSLTQTLQAGAAKQVSDLIEFAPGGTMTNVPLVYSEAFARNRPLAQRFMTAYLKGVRVYNDAFEHGRGKDRVIDIIARHAKLTPALVRSSFPFGLDPNGHITTTVLNDIQEFFVRQGMLVQPALMSQVVDGSFARTAVAQLGLSTD
ncbi:MAG TPA: ABC transporter substrate-binding protein [Candidatus Lustribacter sp.]|nr:ABC transporter substrate-binding protein [Candidatus Lustribacter sp.]